MSMGSFIASQRRCLGLQFRLGALCASMLVPGPALAQAPAQGAAEKLFEEAQAEIESQNWTSARELLSAAFRLDPQPVYAGNLGFVELWLHRSRDAAEHLTFFLREAQDLSPADRERAETKLTEAKTKVGMVTVRVEPATAEVRLDGRPVGMSPLSGPLFVEPGKRTFEAQKDGLPSRSQEIEVAAGKALVVDLRLPQPPVAQPPSEPPPPPASTGTRSKALIYAGIGVSATLAAVGIGTAIGATAIKNENLREWQANGCTMDAGAVPSEACRSNFDKDEPRRSNLAQIAAGTLIGAGVLGAGTLIYGLTGAKPTPSSKPQAAVLVGPQGGVVMVTGQW